MEPHLYQWLENSRCRASGALHSPGAAFHPWPVPGHHLRGSSPKPKVTMRDGVMSVSPVPWGPVAGTAKTLSPSELPS